MKDEAAFWKMMQSGTNHKMFQLWYAADVARYHLNRACRGKRRVSIVIYCNSDEDFSANEPSYSSFLSVRRRYVNKMSIDKVNDATFLWHIEEVSGINTCMYHIGRAFTYSMLMKHCRLEIIPTSILLIF